MKNMGKENPFSVLNFIIVTCFLYYHCVSSAPSGDNLKKDTMIERIKVCSTVDVIANSSYIKSCEPFNYPEKFEEENPNLALCMLVYDTTSKICEYSSKTSYLSKSVELFPTSVQELDKDIQKFEKFKNNTDICKNISSIFNILNHSKVEGFKELIPYLEYSKKILLSKEQCSYTCNVPNRKKINHLCTYLLWASDLFTSLKPIKSEDEQEKSLPTKETQQDAKPVQKKNNENKSEKKDSEVKNIETPNKNEISNTVSKNQENQQHEQNLQLSNQKPDEVPKNTVNTLNSETKDKPNGQKPLDDTNNQGSLPAPPKEEEAADIGEPKKNEGDVDNFQHLPPEEANQDGDLISAEDHQSKKDNIDLDEGIDRETADSDQKESNNLGIEVPIKNSDDDQFQQPRQLIPHPQTFKVEEESHLFTYFSIVSVSCIILYFGYHNKQKIFAILLEGRRGRRGRGSRRRPSTASYHKLDSNLEEAVTSQCSSNVTHVIY